MARRYVVDLEDTNTVDTTIGGITSTAAIRPGIYDIMVGSDATPADQAAEYHLQRYTAAGTAGAAKTPQKLDPGDPAATATAGEAHSAEPTYTASEILWVIALNLRATFRWVSAPGSELRLPATAANGAGFIARTVTSAFNVIVTCYWEE
jgi:hypothetical protein